MIQILYAEHLKMKRTMILKLLIAAPIVTLLLSFLAGSYFYSCAFNWWYTLFYPMLIAMICSQIQEKEKRKLNYQNIMMSPISLKKLWWGKSLLAAGYCLLTSSILTVLIIVVSLILGVTLQCSLLSAALAGVIIFLTSCFQIPFYMYITKRFNFIVTCIVGILFATVGIAFGEKSVWLLIPFTYSNRSMYRVLGIMINGLFLDVEKSNLLVPTLNIVIAIMISCGLFILGTILFAKIVEREAAKR